MIKLSLNLPNKKRLDFKFVSRYGSSNEKSFLPNLEEIRRARKGNKVSRYFRHIFEHKNIKKVLGINLAVIAISTTFVPKTTNYQVVEAKENIIIEDSTVLTTEIKIRYPVENIKISQGYKLYHPGIDFDGITGDLIYPIMAGKVQNIQFSKYSYGNAVLIDHGQGLSSLYAHLSKIIVDKDQFVNTREPIGEMGQTGRSSGDHLHLEVRENGISINPLSVLPRN